MEAVLQNLRNSRPEPILPQQMPDWRQWQLFDDIREFVHYHEGDEETYCSSVKDLGQLTFFTQMVLVNLQKFKNPNIDSKKNYS